MSAPTTALFQFLVYAPDKLDKECLSRRISVREKHLQRAKELMSKGVIKTGGALLSPESIAAFDVDKKMIGSAMIIEESSLDEVKRIVEGDVYYTEEVWDRDRIVILPFASAPL